jgi:hypothetical protein
VSPRLPSFVYARTDNVLVVSNKNITLTALVVRSRPLVYVSSANGHFVVGIGVWGIRACDRYALTLIPLRKP